MKWFLLGALVVLFAMLTAAYLWVMRPLPDDGE